MSPSLAPHQPHVDTPHAPPPVTTIRGDISPDLQVKNKSEFLFISKDQRAFTHGIHKYPAKFFPELPRWLIERYSDKGDVVLDPFMGSGTTNLECLLLKRNNIGIDVDPFSRLLASVKTTPIGKSALASAHQYITQYLENYSSEGSSSPIPDFPYRDNWFAPHVLRELAYIKAGIKNYHCSKKVENFLLITFSSIIRKVSQADDNCTRTVIRKNRPKTTAIGYPIKLFLKRLDNNINGMISLCQKVNKDTYTQIPADLSAVDMHTIDNSTIKLALTSPPYVNAVDYPRTHQLEMYWLGIANGSLRDLKVKHVGTEVVSAQEYENLHLTDVSSADSIIRKIYQIDKRRAFIASKYISDMISNMREVHRVLQDGGRYIIAVGSNTIRGHAFENWRYLKDAAGFLGYEVELVFVSKIINHFIKIPRAERIDDDYIIVLKK